MKNLKIIIIIFLCILLLPSIVKAEECDLKNIKFESISLKDKTNDVKELSPATMDNVNINLNLIMYNVGDYAEYKIMVKNNSNEDINLDKESLNINSKYFDYSLSHNDDPIIIKKNGEKEITLKVQYNKKIETEKFINGKYHEGNNIVVVFSNKQDIFDIITNPKTGNSYLLLIMLILVIIGLTYIIIRRKNSQIYIVLIFGTIIIPISACAICKYSINIDSNITIGKVIPNPCTFDGELVQGVEYVNGQYTYRYMQENGFYSWVNREYDGWGVSLTDKNSTEDVTTPLCSSINNKPIVSTQFMFFTSKASNIDLSSFDTSNVVNMNGMFFSAGSVRNLDLSTFDTSKVNDMAYMFYDAISLENINLSSFDTSKVENMTGMFSMTPSLTNLDLSRFNTSSVSDMTSMFSGTSSLTNINLKNFDTSNVSSMNSMFTGSSVTELDLSSFNTSNVTDMYQMLAEMPSLISLDLSNFDISNVVRMENMFYNSSSLQKIYIKDDFNISSGNNSSNMFLNCTSLIGGNGTTYDNRHVDKEYARIDKPGEPGYFTKK